MSRASAWSCWSCGRARRPRVTGEPMPVSKSPGSKVTAGTLNQTGGFVMRAEKVGADTLLSQIVHMVAAAQRSRAPIQRMADQVAGWFVPVVIAVATLTFVAWLAWGPDPAFSYALITAVAVLIMRALAPSACWTPAAMTMCSRRTDSPAPPSSPSCMEPRSRRPWALSASSRVGMSPFACRAGRSGNRATWVPAAAARSAVALGTSPVTLLEMASLRHHRRTRRIPGAAARHAGQRCEGKPACPVRAAS